MVRRDPAMLWRETIGDRHIELLQRSHLPVEPRVGMRSKAVGPTQPGPEVFYSEFSQPIHSLLEPVIFEVKPLTDAKLGRELAEVL